MPVCGVPDLRCLVRNSPVTMRVPSGLNAALDIWSVWPLSSSRGVPSCASQTFAVRSQLPVTMRVPSGLKATLSTPPVWP